MKIPKDSLIRLKDGKEYVSYAGLIQMANAAGLKELNVELVIAGSPENGHVTIVKATAVMSNGAVFSDVGDASPLNIHDWRLIPHRIRIASTRAKARVLRDALGIGMTCVEEISEPGLKLVESKATEAQRAMLYHLADQLFMSSKEQEAIAELSKSEASKLIDEWKHQLRNKEKWA